MTLVGFAPAASDGEDGDDSGGGAAATGGSVGAAVGAGDCVLPPLGSMGPVGVGLGKPAVPGVALFVVKLEAGGG